MRHRQPILPTLFSNVDIAMLVYFRIAFGWTVFTWALTSLFKDSVTEFFMLPRFHFTYAGFNWVAPLSDGGMVWLFWALAGSALAVIFGLFYRLSSVVLAIAFTYVFLIDKACYQNHYYLICLMSWIMTLVPAQRALSIDALLRPRIHSDVAPAWTLWLIRFQIAVPYFFGGIAKLDADWLRGQPLRDALAERASTPIFGGLLAQEWATWFFAYGGLLFDLLVVPALLWRVTRPWAFALAVAFHLMNSQLFTIGVFPWFMILATVVFFPSDFPRRLVRSGSATRSCDASASVPASGSVQMTTSRRIGVALLALYVVIQVLVPLRHLVQPGNPNWTEVGHRFAWHMMLRGKRCGIRYYRIDPANDTAQPIDLRPYLTEYQVLRFGRDPEMIRQLGRFIAEDLRTHGRSEMKIHVLALVSLNGRKPQLMVDPEVDLTSLPGTWAWGRPTWVVPLTESLRYRGWNAPLEEWEQHVEIPAFMQGKRGHSADIGC